MTSMVPGRGASRFVLLLSAWMMAGTLSSTAMVSAGCCCAVCEDYARVWLDFDVWWDGAWLEYEADGALHECRFDTEEQPRRVACDPQGGADLNWDSGSLVFYPGLVDRVVMRIRDEETVYWMHDLEMDYERYTECTTRCVRAEPRLTVE